MSVRNDFTIKHCSEILQGSYETISSPHGLRLDVEFNCEVGPEKRGFKGGVFGGSLLLLESGIENTIISLAGYRVGD